jgi:hypothetical protein
MTTFIGLDPTKVSDRLVVQPVRVVIDQDARKPVHRAQRRAQIVRD